MTARQRSASTRRYALDPSLAIILAMGAAATAGDGSQPVLSPSAAVQSEPVPHEGDAADDPAIWIHPDDPARSLVLGTDKKGGLNVFDLDGRRLQVVSDGSEPNNVDVLFGVATPDGPIDLAVAGTRAEGRRGLSFWRIDPRTRSLTEFGAVPAFPVLDAGEPYGSCVYRSPRDGAVYAFVTSKTGRVEQYRLEVRDGSVRGTLVRSIEVGSQVEGCVADSDLGRLYVGEEDVGIWRYGAEPDAGSDRVSVASVGEHGLKDDVEGLTIYYASGSKGYLIASSQGSHTFPVFERDGDNAFVATIDPAAGGLPDVGETDGLDVTQAPTSSRFPAGLLVVQDGKPADGRTNFKFYDWREVAGDVLRVDPSRPARPSAALPAR